MSALPEGPQNDLVYCTFLLLFYFYYFVFIFLFPSYFLFVSSHLHRLFIFYCVECTGTDLLRTNRLLFFYTFLKHSIPNGNNVAIIKSFICSFSFSFEFGIFCKVLFLFLCCLNVFEQRLTLTKREQIYFTSVNWPQTQWIWMQVCNTFDFWILQRVQHWNVIFVIKGKYCIIWIISQRISLEIDSI